MAKCFVLRADLSYKAADVAGEQAMQLRAIGPYKVKDAIETAQILLNGGLAFKMVPARDVLENCNDADEVFHAMNMSEDHYMAVGDVIVWNNGRRELCCPDGWQNI